MKIAILYICTGRYNQFFHEFYISSKKHFLSNVEKHFFVWTDDLNLCDYNDVSLIYKECKGFPLDSLMRFEMFLGIKEKLDKFDYTYFFNSNMLFVSDISEEILPINRGEIVFTLNAGYYNKSKFLYPYERNKKSLAFIKFNIKKKYKYVIGGLNGGKTSDYLFFAKECHDRIIQDLKSGLIAVFHDESHINRFYNQHGGKLLPPSFAYPEGQSLPFKSKILIRDKVKIDNYFDKVVDHSKKARITKGIRIICKALIWPFL